MIIAGRNPAGWFAAGWQDMENKMDRKFYIGNRQRLAAQLSGNDVMLFFSGEGRRKTADEDFPFFTNRNFLYLTGIKQERSALLIQKKDDLVS